MTPDRWTLARDGGALPPLEGRCVVLLARGNADLHALGASDILAVQGFRPDHDRLETRGFAVVPVLDQPSGFDAALVQVVKSKVRTLSAVATSMRAVKPGGLILVDGAKEEGIESVLRALKPHVDVEGVFSKAHGKLIWFRRPEIVPDPVADWIATPETAEGGYVTAPGAFSADAPDRGSEILVALTPPLKGRVADLGAGWGYLAAEILAEHEGITHLDLVEAEYDMLDAARANIDDPRAAFHWSDATRFDPTEPYDAIICNPPFHIGRRADPELGRAFISAAARMLKPSGKFIMVANRHLPYEAALKEAFGTGRLIAELEGFKLYEAAKPRQAQGRAARGQRR